MLRLYKSHQSTTPQPKKESYIDQYGSDSEEEDQRREQAEIKDIINKARIKNANKFKIRNVPTSERQRTIQAKFDTISSPHNPIYSKTADPNGFFSNAPPAEESLVKRDFAEEMKRLSQPKPKAEMKTQPTPRDMRGLLLDTDRLYIDPDKPENRNVVNKKISESKKKQSGISKNPKDIEFQKESFNSLLLFYSKSSTKYPLKFVPNRSNRASRNPSSAAVGMEGKEPINASLEISFIGKVTEEELGKEHEGIEEKDFQELIPELIVASNMNACDLFDKKNPGEVPRFKMMDWADIMKKIDSNKFELLIINPIDFAVEDCLEIKSNDPKKVRDTMHEAIKELVPNVNEAKYIIVYYYDKETNEKKVLFSKFLFFLKNHRYYAKNLKNEKEIITHYLLILALLEFRVQYETNPFKDDKVENSKKKAFNMFKNTEQFNSFVLEWLTLKLQPIIAVEKVYVNLNVGGKADSNFTFNMHEHLCYAYPKFSQYLVNHVQPSAGFKSVNTVSKVTGSDLMISARDTGDRKEALSHKYTPRVTEKTLYTSTNVIPKPKTENTQNYNDPNNQLKQPVNSPPKGMIPPQFARTTLSSPIAKNRVYNPGQVEAEQSVGMFGQRSMSLTGQGFFGSNKIVNKVENKVYLSNQRMNTSYGHFLKQRQMRKYI